MDTFCNVGTRGNRSLTLPPSIGAAGSKALRRGPPPSKPFGHGRRVGKELARELIGRAVSEVAEQSGPRRLSMIGLRHGGRRAAGPVCRLNELVLADEVGAGFDASLGVKEFVPLSLLGRERCRV